MQQSPVCRSARIHQPVAIPFRRSCLDAAGYVYSKKGMRQRDWEMTHPRQDHGRRSKVAVFNFPIAMTIMQLLTAGGAPEFGAALAQAKCRLFPKQTSSEDIGVGMDGYRASELWRVRALAYRHHRDRHRGQHRRARAGRRNIRSDSADGGRSCPRAVRPCRQSGPRLSAQGAFRPRPNSTPRKATSARPALLSASWLSVSSQEFFQRRPVHRRPVCAPRFRLAPAPRAPA